MNLRGTWNWYYSENSLWPSGAWTRYLSAGPDRQVWAVTVQPKGKNAGVNDLYSLMHFHGEKWQLIDARQAGLTNAFAHIGRVHCDPNGRLWLYLEARSHKHDVISCFDRQSAILFHAHEKGLPSEIVVLDFASDAEGNCWVAMGSLGVYYFREGSWHRFFLIEEGGEGFVSNIALDHKGHLWFVVRRPKAATFLWYDGKQCHVYAEAPIDYYLGLKTFAVDKLGKLWIGCLAQENQRGGGLWTLEVGEKEWLRYTHRNSALPDHEIYDIAFDRAGRIWAAGGDSLTIFEGGHSVNWSVAMPGVAHRPIPSGAILPDWSKAEKQLIPLFSPIAADSLGQVWAACGEGLARFSEM
jgi:hypothetical protein